MKGIIIDGVAASGKTTILKQIHSEIIEVKPSMTKLFVSEHYTERMLEHLKESGKLDGFYIKNHIDKIIQTMAIYQEMLNNSKFNNDPKGADIFVTLERFILTHLSSMNIEDKYSLDEAKYHFQALNKLGIKQIALVIPEVKLKERIMSTLEYRNDKWKEYLFSKGGEKEILEYYVDWQNKFLYYIDKFNSIIDTLVIKVEDNNYIKYSNVIWDKIFGNKH